MRFLLARESATIRPVRAIVARKWRAKRIVSISGVVDCDNGMRFGGVGEITHRFDKKTFIYMCMRVSYTETERKTVKIQ